MPHTLDLKIYKMTRFGYYSRKSKDAAPPIVDIPELLNNLMAWSAKLPIVQNCTFAGGETIDSEKILCVSVVKYTSNNDFLLTLWVAIDTGDKNSVGAIPKGALTNSQVVLEENTFSTGSIPGYPIYLYIIPELKIVTPVRINQGRNGIKEFKKYITGFLQRCSKYCNYETNEDGERVVSYFGKKGSSELNYLPSFKYKNWQDKNISEFLIANREKIKKVVKTDLIVRTTERSVARRLFGISTENDSRLTDVKFKYELDITPQEDELQAMIDEVVESEDNIELDYGFKIGSEMHWLGHALQKHRFTAEIRRRDNILFSASGVLSFLQGVRHTIIGELAKDDGDDEENKDDG
jgi:hypothetical protein